MTPARPAATGLLPRIGGSVVIIANAADIDLLGALSQPGVLGDHVAHALPADQAVPDEWLHDAGLLVIEVEAGCPQSLARLAELRARHGELPVIAALHGTDVALARTLLRQGVADIARLPFDAAELAGQLADASTARRGEPAGLAPLVTVIGSIGGCGATTVITHLAAALAEARGGERKTCVVDLDLQAGEVAFYVGQLPRTTISALLDAADRLDDEFVQGAVTDSGHGFAVVAAPESITALDDIDDERLLALLAQLRRTYECVLVDLPADLTGWALSVALASSEVLMVTELSVAGIRQARRRLDLLASVGIEPDRVRLVANRVERALFRPIRLDEASEALGHPVAATLADEGPEMSRAQDEGRLITDIHKHCRFSSDIERLARALVAESR